MELSEKLTDIDIDIENQDSNEYFNCTICMEELDIKERCITNCNHIYCTKCLHEWFNKKKNTCPTCRDEITNYENNNIKNHIIKIEEEVNQRNEPNTINLIVSENERILERLRSKFFKLNMLICANIIYAIYNLTMGEKRYQEYIYYKNEYENCSGILNDMENSLEETLIYSNSELILCKIPEMYINNCT